MLSGIFFQGPSDTIWMPYSIVTVSSDAHFWYKFENESFESFSDFDE